VPLYSAHKNNFSFTVGVMRKDFLNLLKDFNNLTAETSLWFFYVFSDYNSD